MGSKQSAGLFVGATCMLLLLSFGVFYEALRRESSLKIGRTQAAYMPHANVPANSFSLVIEPQDGMAPLKSMIKNASSSIELVMYEFEDKTIEQLLAARAQEGLSVRVILDNGYFGEGSSINEEAFDYLRSRGVEVHWSQEYFALTHEKSLVVDGKEAFLMTFNLSPQYYTSDRDFGVLDTDPNDLAAIESAFDSDWNGRNAAAQNGDDLVWSPGSRTAILSLIQNATSSLDVYNEEMEDPEIIDALSAAAKRGVAVDVVMTDSSEWKSAFETLAHSGVHIRTYASSAPLYIHAKVVIADRQTAFVGSENFSSTSLDQNRELGAIFSNRSAVSTLLKTFAQDWSGAAAFSE